ncbi:ATP-dependent Clp protease proteolytic subunit [Metaclostridioides mangenotii]|uniref:ATP-dependent Clp protease proteolytic subunit n=2 Tax=Metaclostridioides mangenotii TaxID=1540 RepID=UPI0004660530|nr:ATP-dependent Clp protease proteolytic subunit [Clostridioides mangenotii]
MRVINLIGEINDGLTKTILEEVFKIEQEDKKIIEANEKLADKKDYKELEDLTINITSVGGLVYGVNAIYDALSKLKCKVITRGFGLCASGGFWLMLAGDERYAGKNTNFLYHTMSYGYYGKLKECLDYASYQNQVQERLDKIILEKTKITQKLLEEHRKEDWWLNFEEAFDLDIIQGEIK